MKTILVVDDERDTVTLLKTALSMHGYSVITAANGTQALEQARGAHPSLILLDVMMPEMDGIEVLRHLKGDPATSAITIVMLTAKTDYSDMQQCWDLGSDLFLEKPFKMTELMSYVKSLTED